MGRSKKSSTTTDTGISNTTEVKCETTDVRVPAARRRAGNKTDTVVTDAAAGVQPVQSRSKKKSGENSDSNISMVSCHICRRTYKAGSKGIRDFSLQIKIDERACKIENRKICESCLRRIPDFLAGAIHLACNIPKEEFDRGFLYPPFSYSLESRTSRTSGSITRNAGSVATHTSREGNSGNCGASTRVVQPKRTKRNKEDAVYGYNEQDPGNKSEDSSIPIKADKPVRRRKTGTGESEKAADSTSTKPKEGTEGSGSGFKIEIPKPTRRRKTLEEKIAERAEKIKAERRAARESKKK